MFKHILVPTDGSPPAQRAVRLAMELARVRCGCSYVRGNFPYQEIIDAARRGGGDLIVTGSHGRRGISRLLLGSQTNMVLAHSTIPVMVCR